MTTVKQLRELLDKFDDDMRVVIDGYEGGLKDVSAAHETKVSLDVNKEWYYGPHVEVIEGECYIGTPVPVIRIG